MSKDKPLVTDCGGHLNSSVGGRYRRCNLGHVHCADCLRQAKRFRNAWTCGKCPKAQAQPDED